MRGAPPFGPVSRRERVERVSAHHVTHLVAEDETADRAGLLATQDPAAAFRVHMKLASGGHLEHLDTTSFFAQAAEYEASGTLRDSVLKLLLVEAQSHPFAVVRAGELRRWIEGGDYTRVLSGDYPRRADDESANVTQAAQEAARAYAEAFRQSQATTTKLIREASTVFGSVKGWVGDTFKPSDGA